MNPKIKNILSIIIGASLVIAFLIGAVYLEYYTTEVSTVLVKNVFVDIDGDGDLDLLVSGEVVVNADPFEAPLATTP